MVKQKFPYKWYLKDGYPSKDITPHNLKVFSTFSCGGGSTMGYKLAGYKVLGCLEIDPKIMACYKENHHPLYAYQEGIQTFKLRDDLPEELYNLDILDQSPPCFTEDTLVMTSSGFKTINNINIDDLVLTHTNSFKSVIKTMQKKVNSLYSLKIQGSLPIEVTGEHPFYVRTMTKSNNSSKRIFSTPFWKEVKDLTIVKGLSNYNKVQDYIGIAINNKSEFPIWNGTKLGNGCGGKKTVYIIKNTLDFTNNNFWYLIGRWFGDGWVRHNEYNIVSKKNRYDFIICCGKHEKESFEQKIKNYTTKYSIKEYRTSYRFTISSKELCHYVSQFGKGALNKKLTGDILNLPKEQLTYFLNGYLDADGHINKKNGKTYCGSISKELIYGIQAVVYKIYNTPTSIIERKPQLNHTIEGRKVIGKISYQLQFFKEPHKQQHGFYEDGYLWVPFRKLEKINKFTMVYNLSVDKDESYTVNNFICHNCSSFSMSGSREKDWGKEKVFREGQAKQVLDTLFFDAIDLVAKLQPKVCIFENVEGLTFGAARDYMRKILYEIDKAGYYVQHYLLDASLMGVPQRRRRIFFIGFRKDLAKPFLRQADMFTQLPYLDLKFKGKDIPYKAIEEHDVTRKPLNVSKTDRWIKCPIDGHPPANNPESTNTFGYFYRASPDRSLPTITAGASIYSHYLHPEEVTENELILAGSFPLDYNFLNVKPQYLIGMSVPPVMTANIADRIYEQWLSKL